MGGFNFGVIVMSGKSNVAEKLILFAAFLVFAGLIVAFAMSQSSFKDDNKEVNSDFHYKTTSKSSFVDNSSGTASAVVIVNINNASKDELMTLPGIGEKKAQAIIDYREQNGPFMKVEDITEVSGIGDATLNNIKDMITVD